MPVDLIYCPACGAPARIPVGKRVTVCEYCGSQIKEQVSDTELKYMEEGNKFSDAITAAIHCIRSRDYKTATEYADKAANMAHNDPAPFMVKYVSALPGDYRKASSFYNISKDMRAQKPSAALSEDGYRELLEVYASNYFYDRSEDIRRMFITIRRIDPDDINNVRKYEYNKRISDYEQDPELMEAFRTAAAREMEAYEKDVPSTGYLDNGTWTTVKKFRDTNMFRIGGIVVADPSQSGRALQCMQKYGSVLDQKWESVFKSGNVDGTKDQVRQYRSECDAMSRWLKTVR